MVKSVFRPVVSVSLVCILAAFCPAASAVESSAHVSDDPRVVRLVELNPGASNADVMDAVKDIADRTGSDVDDVLDDVLAEAESHVEAESSERALLSSSSSDDDTTYMLGKGNNTGDIFYTPASTLGYDHGHVGIYSSTSKIIEAPGIGKLSHEILATTVWVSKGAVKQNVRTAQYRRDAAATHARSYLNREYNAVFVNNKKKDGKVNCSQLVWAAYYYGPGIDLDSDGGNTVWPQDIRDSSLTVTYYTF